MNTQTLSLKQRWDDLKQTNPHMRIRNAAEQLNTSEMELLATGLLDNVYLLTPEIKSILLQVESLGKVMALTRNSECVHERKGVYKNGDFSNNHVGLFVNQDIDLRIFLSHWKYCFALVDAVGDTFRKSLQFFDKSGQAIHKIYLTPESNEQAFEQLVQKYKAQDQSIEGFNIQPCLLEMDERMDQEIDIKGFNQKWIELKDTHDFYGLLKKYHLTRTQALRLAPSEYYAKKVNKQSLVTLLESASAKKVPIMVFVGNSGNIQIHTGEINNTLWHKHWFNIMDPDFNMHLDMDSISQVWIVRKPTIDGVVTSLEVYNEMGQTIVQFFGKRKPGIPELESWRQLIADLHSLD